MEKTPECDDEPTDGQRQNWSGCYSGLFSSFFPRASYVCHRETLSHVGLKELYHIPLTVVEDYVPSTLFTFLSQYSRFSTRHQADI